MTNKIKYFVKINGKVVKSGVDHINNKDFRKFEKKLISSIPHNTDDNVEVLFR